MWRYPHRYTGGKIALRARARPTAGTSAAAEKERLLSVVAARAIDRRSWWDWEYWDGDTSLLRINKINLPSMSKRKSIDLIFDFDFDTCKKTVYSSDSACNAGATLCNADRKSVE